MEGGDSLEVIGGKKCVICVGSTGAGKSTLIKKMTGEEVKTSSGVESTTTMTELFKEKSWIPLSEEEYYYWVDTQGVGGLRRGERLLHLQEHLQLPEGGEDDRNPRNHLERELKRESERNSSTASATDPTVQQRREQHLGASSDRL